LVVNAHKQLVLGGGVTRNWTDLDSYKARITSLGIGGIGYCTWNSKNYSIQNVPIERMTNFEAFTAQEKIESIKFFTDHQPEPITATRDERIIADRASGFYNSFSGRIEYPRPGCQARSKTLSEMTEHEREEYFASQGLNAFPKESSSNESTNSYSNKDESEEEKMRRRGYSEDQIKLLS
jgi:hypothetical protein